MPKTGMRFVTRDIAVAMHERQNSTTPDHGILETFIKLVEAETMFSISHLILVGTALA